MADKSARTYLDCGLLVLRVGVGIAFLAYGWPKLSGGSSAWTEAGKMGMAPFGTTSGFAVWGFIAAVAEFVGGIALITGVLVRPFALLMLITMIVVTRMHVSAGDAFIVWSHPAVFGVVFLSLVFSGAGRLNLLAPFKKSKNPPTPEA